MTKQTRNTIDVGDITLNYYRKGSSKNALLLLHGYGQDATVFSEYLDNIDPSYKIYAIDLRGHGKSQSGKDTFSIKTLAIDILRFISLKPFNKVTIVGNSYGANVAMYLAKMDSSTLDKMVLIGGNLYLKALPKAYYFKQRQKYRLIKPLSLLSKKARATASKLSLLLNNTGVYPEDLHEFSFPTLVVDADKNLIDAQHTSLIAKSIPQAQRLTIAGADYQNILSSKELMTAINEFLLQ